MAYNIKVRKHFDPFGLHVTDTDSKLVWKSINDVVGDKYVKQVYSKLVKILKPSAINC